MTEMKTLTIGGSTYEVVDAAARASVALKLDASDLPSAVEDALSDAKASGDFKGDKGDTGETGPQGPQGDAGANATITNATASVTATTGTPTVTVTVGGTESARTFDFAFSGIKGEKGDTGAPGSDANLPYTYGTTDMTAGTSALATGTLYFVYE